MIRIVAVYPNAAGTRFDGDYYRNTHTPLARRLLEPHGLSAIRTVLGGAALDGAAPPYWAIAEMVFDSRPSFDAAMAAASGALFADIANYTDTTPVLQVGTLADPSPET